MKTISQLNWCFSTLGCPDFSLEKACELAADYKIGLIEIRCLEDEMDLPTYFKKKYSTATRVLSIFEKYKLKLASLDTSFHLIKNSDQEKDDLLSFAEWAQALGAPRIRVFDGGKMDSPLSASEKAEGLKTYLWWKELKAKKHFSTDIMIETHGAVITSPSVLAISEAMGSPKNILWDTHHIWANQHEELEKTWQAIKNHVCHLHVKDSNGLGENGRPDYTLLGEGKFPLEKLLTLFASEDFQLPVSIEWEKKWHSHLPKLEEVFKGIKAKGWFPT
jgi:sugar phosphate isomerase/epimerase